MQQPLHVVLVFWAGTELRNVHLPVPRGKGKETESRASCLHTRDVSVAATTLFLLHWELGLDLATPNFGGVGVLEQYWDNMAFSWAPLCPAPILFHGRWEGWILLDNWLPVSPASFPHL